MKNVNQLFDLMTKSDGLMPSTGWDRPFNEFTCEYCGQHFSKEFCQISVFLHGIIFLFGQETGYLGFTCANCQKTLLFNGTGRDIRTLNKEMIANNLSLIFGLSLSYFSSVNYYPSQIPRLKNFDIKCSGHFVKNSWLEDKIYILETIRPDYTDWINYTNIDRRPDLKLNYLCSDQDQMKNYSYNYLGHLVTLWWFKEDEITKLSDLENSSNLRIFPRYVSRQFTDFEDIENYCWKHKLYLEFLYTHQKMTKITNEEIEDSIRKEEKRRKTDLSQAAELAQILITPKKYLATQPSVDIQHSIEYWHNVAGLFESNKANKVITDFMPGNIDEWKQEKIKFHEMSRKVSQNLHKEYVQDFLVQDHDPFISAYTKLAQSKKFTYAAVWKLKNNLLSRLYSHILENERDILAVNKNLQDQNDSTNFSDNSIIASDLEKEVEELRSKFQAFNDIISNDPKIYKILSEIHVLASDTLNMEFLIEGETGTGKELFAKAIHAASPCPKDKERVVINCSAISPNLFESLIFGLRITSGTVAKGDTPGKLELADNSTVFFDEIGDFPLEQQPKLLRTLQEREIEPVGGKTTKINTTFIFATHMNLAEKVRKGEFRKDFYYRVGTTNWTIPPLRERPADIPLLLRYFIEIYSKKFHIEKLSASSECLHVLAQYSWPGNVRQLEEQTKKILLLRKGKKDFSELRSSEFDLPPMSKHTGDSKSFSPLKNIEIKPAKDKRIMPDRITLEKLLKEQYLQQGKKYGVIKKVAELIPVDQATLSREIKKLGIKWDI